MPQTANTARRILWQRGHAATTPSKIRELVEQATVQRLEDALEPLQTIGFAILDDISEAFAQEIDALRNIVILSKNVRSSHTTVQYPWTLTLNFVTIRATQ